MSHRVRWIMSTASESHRLRPVSGAEGTLSAADVAALRAIADLDAPRVLARDWEALTAVYAAGAVRMPPNAPAIVGREAIRQSFDALPPISAFDFRMLDVQGDGEIAYMRGLWSITVAPPGADEVSDSGKSLIVFRKQLDDSWLMVAEAWNSGPP